MKRVKFFNLIALAMTFLAIVPKMESQILPPIPPLPPILPLPQPSLQPLCLSQLALVSHACAMVPRSVTPPPPPPPSPDNHGHRHNHGHRGNQHHNLQEENCCRWAKEVDSQCICDVLVLLPPFLTKPLHQYSIHIGESCNVTYSCGGPI